MIQLLDDLEGGNKKKHRRRVTKKKSEAKRRITVTISNQCKGMEFDVVVVQSEFSACPKEGRKGGNGHRDDDDDGTPSAWGLGSTSADDVGCFYVAQTRAKHRLFMPEDMYKAWSAVKEQMPPAADPVAPSSHGNSASSSPRLMKRTSSSSSNQAPKKNNNATLVQTKSSYFPQKRNRDGDGDPTELSTVVSQDEATLDVEAGEDDDDRVPPAAGTGTSSERHHTQTNQWSSQ